MTSGNWSAQDSQKFTNWSSVQSFANKNSMSPWVPTSNDEVVFTVNAASAGPRQVVTLEERLDLTNVVFNDQAIHPLTIQSYTIGLTTTGVGIRVDTGSAAHRINSAVMLLNNQTWQVDTPALSRDNTLTVAGKISGNLLRGITKSGGGTLVLTGDNTYTGPTYIDQGTLRADNTAGSATGTAAVTIRSGGTLAGSGAVSQANLYGTISAGAPDAAGLLQTGPQAWFDGARLSVDLQSPSDTGTAGVNWDLVQANGPIDFGATGQFVIDVQSLAPGGGAGALAGLDPMAPMSWKILTASQLLNFDPARFTIRSDRFEHSGGAVGFSLRAQDNAVYLEIAPIPEPGGAIFLLGAALCLARRSHSARSLIAASA